MIPLNAVGLFFDFIGVLYLGSAFFSQGIKDIAQLATPRWDFHKDLSMNLASTKFDGMTGTTFLAAGFLCQCIYVFCQIELPFFWSWPIAFFVIVIAIAPCLFKKKTVEIWVKRVERAREEKLEKEAAESAKPKEV